VLIKVEDLIIIKNLAATWRGLMLINLVY